MRRRYSIASAMAFADRLADRAAWYSGGAWERGRIAVRSTAAWSGLRLRKEYLELGCAAGVDASGLFSEVTAVLGCLQHYEQHTGIYAGLRVDFKEEGLYYEPAAGPNWWQYYFEPVTIGDDVQASARVVPPWQHDSFADTTEQTMPRTAAAVLLARYICAKPIVREQVDGFWREYVQDSHTIGIHYRGTDKSEEAPIMPYDAVVAAVRAAVPDGDRSWKLFVATDEQAFLDYMITTFPGQVLHRTAQRSIDGTPVHKMPGGGFQKGLDAIVDCLLLSKCTRLVRTASNLGLVASYLNPVMPVTLVKNSQ